MVGSSEVILKLLLALTVCGSLRTYSCTAFLCTPIAPRQTMPSTCQLSMATDANNGGKRNDSREDQPNSESGERNSRGNEHDAAEWESLYIRTARMRLEEENKRRFLKSRAAKLPYEQCKEWAQSQNMWHSKKDWYEWVELGENLSAYIPSDPEAYFSRQGTWVSWDDFLG